MSMYSLNQIEDIILGMADLVKENHMLRKRVDELELQLAIESAQQRSYISAEAKKEYDILCDIQRNNNSCNIAASNGWSTSDDYIDDWKSELYKRMCTEKEIKPL